MTNQSIIQLENISKEYQRGSEVVHAVRDISLSITKGEYVAIVGHSGSGKTTLLNMIGCLDRPSSGRVVVNGNDLTGATEKKLTEMRKSTIGFVFQQFFLIPTLTVLQNVQLPTLFSRKVPEKKAEELLHIVGLEKRLSHLPGQLSGGEMQRVAIARSLINSPGILLADEPTGNLDSKNAETIMSLFDTLHAQGITIVVVTHNAELSNRCERRLHIEDGTIKN